MVSRSSSPTIGSTTLGNQPVILTGDYTEGMAGANAVGAIALKDKDLQRLYIERLWNVKAPSGQWRYYNGMVYMLSMLHVSGKFRIY